jgi:HAD superfamily hydrolase (TIGR01450 family)
MERPAIAEGGVARQWDRGHDGVMGWVFDLDGVIWLGDEPVAGSAQAVATLLSGGADVLFVTNMSAVPVTEVEAKLGRHGIDARGRVVTSALAAAELVQPGERALLCAGPGVREALEARGAVVVTTGPADVVVVGYHRDFDYERMTTAARAVWGGARLVATNDDATYPTPDGLIPGGGAILASIVTATGASPIIAGKPHEPIAALVRGRLGPDGVMVGDRADTDGGFARVLGYRFVLVLSGVTTAADLPVTPEPDLIAPNAAAAVRELFGHC